MGLVFLLSFGPWAFKRLTSFVKEQVETLNKGSALVHYHQLAVTDSSQESPDVPEEDTSTAFDFTLLAKESHPERGRCRRPRIPGM